jgi:hypothetical protein
LALRTRESGPLDAEGSTREPALSREAVVLGAVVAALVGVMLAVGAATQGSRYLFNSDAIYSYRVAIDPFGSGHSFAGFPPDVGVAYRYGRILYSLVAWLLAFGRPSLIVWTMPLTFALGMGLLAASAAQLVRRSGRPAVRGLWVLVVPAMWATLPIVFLDPFALGLVVLAFALDAGGRRGAARAVAALALLAREFFGLAFVPLILRDVRRRDRRAVTGWVAAGVPLIAWWAWVRIRIGAWPPLDPAYGRRGALSWPLGGFIQVIREGKPLGGWFLVAIVLAGLTVLAGIGVWVAHKRSLLAQASLALGGLVALLGPSAVRLPAQTVRLLLPAQALATLTFLTRARARSGVA